jgi:hypothetical protein
MPKYFFNLKHQGNIIHDLEGAELPDDAAAMAHARMVAAELMRHREPRMRGARLQVCDDDRIRCFDLLFASVDESIAHLAPELRTSVEVYYGNAASLTDAINDIRFTLLQVKGTIAKSNQAPYIAAIEGVRLAP